MFNGGTKYVPKLLQVLRVPIVLLARNFPSVDFPWQCWSGM